MDAAKSLVNTSDYARELLRVAMSNQNGSFEMRPEMFKASLCDLENASAIMLVFENNNTDTTVPRPLNSELFFYSNCEKSGGERMQHRV